MQPWPLRQPPCCATLVGFAAAHIAAMCSTALKLRTFGPAPRSSGCKLRAMQTEHTFRRSGATGSDL
eukprot:7485008-Alexandrium_andersonii.AAC.1